MRFAGVRFVASVYPQVKHMMISLTSGEGDLRAPSFMRSLVVKDWPNSARGVGVGFVPNRCGIVGGLVAHT